MPHMTSIVEPRAQSETLEVTPDDGMLGWGLGWQPGLAAHDDGAQV